MSKYENRELYGTWLVEKDTGYTFELTAFEDIAVLQLDMLMDASPEFISACGPGRLASISS